MKPPPTTALLLTVLSLLTVVDSLGSASTLATVDSTGAVCAILAGARTIQCAVPGFPRLQSLLPNISFDAVSGGRDFLCGLRSGGRSLLCWNAAGNSTGGGFTLRRLYAGDAALQGVSVGSDQVAAVRNGSGVVFWRGTGEGFPRAASGAFRSLTSGNGFSCAVAAGDGTVRCWGRSGVAIQSGFVNTSMSIIVAGDSHVCGISSIGFVLCKGSNSSGQSNAPPEPAFGFSGLALGAAYSCAIRQQNGTVVCWGNHVTAPAKNTSFVLLAAGGNITCGLTSTNFSVICWRPDGSDPLATAAQLPRIQPGICVADEGNCQCGPFPDSGSFCSGSGVICNPCSGGPRDENPSPPPPPAVPSTARRGRSKGFLTFMIVGAVGGFAGLCTILYWLYIGVCRQKRVHNSVQPTIAAPRVNGESSPAGSDPAAHFSSPPPFRNRSRVFRRQGSSAMRRQRSGPSRGGSNVQHYSFKSPEAFAFSDLAAATKGFANENKIGAGSFGTVYKGKLPDGREVAIKRSETGPKTKKWQEKESAFQSELALLSRLHHKHLVGLVGFCEEGEERLLVYDYMKNGALYDHLHPAGGGAASSDGEINSWKMRIKILLDAARGVEYLHKYAEPPIIHRDIKSSNILLDGSWTARVSDFGLSLAGGEGGQQLSMKAAGTVGYMDPEYYGLQQLTAKSDVYGLGVVMLETLTGKRAIFKGEGGGATGGDGLPESVVDYAVPSIVEGRLRRVLDPRVGPPGPSEADAVELVAYTAVRCVSLEGRERPAMSDVVDNLESALALCEDRPASFSSTSARSAD